MSWFLTNFIAAFLLPPFNLLLLMIAGILLWRRNPIFARRVCGIALALLWLLSTPVIAEFLLQRLENPASALPLNSQETDRQTAEAIVILGGGLYAHAPEYGGDTVGIATLQRLRYAAGLARQLKLPILVSGGAPTGTTLTEADLMQNSLKQDFHISAQWKETSSDNTYQSAYNSFRILNNAGIHRILLVTDSWHMPRAEQAFIRAGFHVTPAPTAFTTRYRLDLLAFMPDATALYNSRLFFHELIGMLWYRLKS